MYLFCTNPRCVGISITRTRIGIFSFLFLFLPCGWSILISCWCRGSTQTLARLRPPSRAKLNYLCIFLNFLEQNHLRLAVSTGSHRWVYSLIFGAGMEKYTKSIIWKPQSHSFRFNGINEWNFVVFFLIFLLPEPLFILLCLFSSALMTAIYFRFFTSSAHKKKTVSSPLSKIDVGKELAERAEEDREKKNNNQK